MRLERDEEELGGPNLTPLIDVVFLLLVFFLTATTFKKKDEVKLDLELPESTAGKAGKVRKTILIEVAADGQVVVDGRQVTMAALEQKLRAAAARDRKQPVLIRGDKKSAYGRIFHVLDTCELAGLRAVSFDAERNMGGGR